MIFAIDVSESTLKKPPGSGSKKDDTDSIVMAALKTASQVMQQRIISQPKDMMGILFFGTEKTKVGDMVGASLDPYTNCYLHIDLDVPSAADVRALKNMAETGKDPDGILKPAKGSVSIYNMLNCANTTLMTNAPNFGSRRLFIITDNDDPHAGDRLERERAVVRAKDLFDLGVTVELFPVTRQGQNFDLNKFYTVSPRACTDCEQPGICANRLRISSIVILSPQQIPITQMRSRL